MAGGGATSDRTVANTGSATTEKARQVWIASQSRIGSEIDRMHDAFSAAAKGHEREGDITQAVRHTANAVLDKLDDSLAHTLNTLGKTQHGPECDKLVQQAHALVKRYQGHVASDPVIAALDRNPFAPTSIGKTMTAALAALSKSIV